MSSKHIADLMKLPLQTNMRIRPPTVSPFDPILCSRKTSRMQHNIQRKAVTKDGALVGLVKERRLLQVDFPVV